MIIYSTRNQDSWSWYTVSKGVKYVTVKFSTCIQGHRDFVAKYDIEDLQAILENLKTGVAPLETVIKPLRIVYSAPVQ